jgi:hypothetical protein
VAGRTAEAVPLPKRTGGVSTELLKRPKDPERDKNPGIAHLRDWEAYDAARS